jgi:hypothetical protein
MYSGELNSLEFSDFLERMGHDELLQRYTANAPDISEAIAALRNSAVSRVSSLRIHESTPTFTSVDISEVKTTSYSEQRSEIIHGYQKETNTGFIPHTRSVGVGTTKSIELRRARPFSMQDRAREPELREQMHQSAVNPRAGASDSVQETVLRIKEHVSRSGLSIPDLICKQSLSVVELYEILVSLSVPDVDAQAIDQLLLHLSAPVYWERGYFSDITRENVLSALDA